MSGWTARSLRRDVIIEAAVLVSGPVAARFGGVLERLVRAEARRCGEVVPDDLPRLLFELVDAGQRWRAAHPPRAPATSGAGSDGSEPDFRSGIVEFMSTREVAEVLSITDRGVRDLRARGRLPARRAPIGRSWLFDRMDVEDDREARER